MTRELRGQNLQGLAYRYRLRGMDGVHICQLLRYEASFLVFNRRAYAFGIYGAEPKTQILKKHGAAMTVCMDVKMLVTYFVFQDTLIWTIKRHSLCQNVNHIFGSGHTNLDYQATLILTSTVSPSKLTLSNEQIL